MESTQLRVRSRLDHTFCDDGNRRLAGLETGRDQGRKAAALVVCCATRLERRLVVDLFRTASARLGIRGDRDPVGCDRIDSASVFPAFQARWLAACSLLGMGELRHGAELCDLAI